MGFGDFKPMTSYNLETEFGIESDGAFVANPSKQPPAYLLMLLREGNIVA